MNRDTEVYADPVELPEGIHHGGSRAYAQHRCRCRHCVQWRRLFSQMTYWKSRTDRIVRRLAARDYLASVGIQVYGRGPFRKNPHRLARLIADHLNDDLDAWFNTTREELNRGESDYRPDHGIDYRGGDHLRNQFGDEPDPGNREPWYLGGHRPVQAPAEDEEADQ